MLHTQIPLRSTNVYSVLLFGSFVNEFFQIFPVVSLEFQHSINSIFPESQNCNLIWWDDSYLERTGRNVGDSHYTRVISVEMIVHTQNTFKAILSCFLYNKLPRY